MSKFTVKLIVALSIVFIGLASALALSNTDGGKHFEAAQSYLVDALGNVSANLD